MYWVRDVLDVGSMVDSSSSELRIGKPLVELFLVDVMDFGFGFF